ncbi:PspA/IM30 family protein [Aureimonas jatrophae]|uniref:Phage shock protein A n=1 Tax=Aureimonas jatrophae TaxID=1166073 RepID=A0A1H0LM86_9HYPH|nr:PspA/IM30 family protein [Aureimonas jatrophae]MBB3952588.1 phage shock protein A [Aureimonas jatrophae]SDO69328.1 Phage shock protein A [Aureimonas jatrophae]
MSVWGKLFSAVRGGINEAAESAADGQALRILDQEIRDAEGALRQARGDLAGIMATAKSLGRRVDEARLKDEKDLASARAAMAAGREDLARQLADRMSRNRADLARDEAELQRLQGSQAQMLRAVQDTETRIQTMRREVESVKANESLLKAQSAIASSHAGVNSRLGSAMESLERVKRRQEAVAGRLEAGAELQALQSGADLDRQLLEAGIGGNRSSSDDIFAEIARGDAPKSLPGGTGNPAIGYEPKS